MALWTASVQDPASLEFIGKSPLAAAVARRARGLEAGRHPPSPAGEAGGLEVATEAASAVLFVPTPEETHYISGISHYPRIHDARAAG